ncbi:hypothetical protein [Actinomadura sp. KC216]|uniref:hypothetical protein n=1 Tax=Actinomadura sp. KC216 TaxID=2530370 RepID=UPI001FB5D274|nr:hypothetical protein [Actinomadura sp. KC216]
MTELLTQLRESRLLVLVGPGPFHLTSTNSSALDELGRGKYRARQVPQQQPVPVAGGLQTLDLPEQKPVSECRPV